MLFKVLKSIKRRGPISVFKEFYDIYWFDIFYGTDTALVRYEDLFQKSNKSLTDAEKEAVEYVPTRTSIVSSSLNWLISYDKSVLDSGFLDFGSGKGKVLIMANKKGFNVVEGVELTKELNDICRENIEKLKLKNTKTICEDATTFQINKQHKTFFFFNPFSEVIMKQVLENISKSIPSTPHYIIYINPVSRELLEEYKYSLLYEEKDLRITIWKS